MTSCRPTAAHVPRLVCGAYLALHDACSRLKSEGSIVSHPLNELLAAVSVGIVDGVTLLDLDYSEDSRAQVDMNVVMTGSGRFVEVQGTAEGLPFTRQELDALLERAEGGIRQLHRLQEETLSVAPDARSEE